MFLFGEPLDWFRTHLASAFIRKLLGYARIQMRLKHGTCRCLFRRGQSSLLLEPVPFSTESTAMASGLRWHLRIKPQSFASSRVADKLHSGLAFLNTPAATCNLTLGSPIPFSGHEPCDKRNGYRHQATSLRKKTATQHASRRKHSPRL